MVCDKYTLYFMYLFIAVVILLCAFVYVFVVKFCFAVAECK